jgi:protein SCO1/2
MRRLAAFVAILLLCWPGTSRASTPELYAHAKPIAPFSLTDQHGKPFTNASLKGRWTLMAIGYLNCPDVCPFTLGNLAALYKTMAAEVPAAGLPQVVFVSVDPKRDRPNLGGYVTSFHPAFLGVTGAPDQILALTRSIGGYFKLHKPDASGNYEVDHSSFVTIIGANGQALGQVTPPFDPKTTAAFLIKLADADGRISTK